MPVYLSGGLGPTTGGRRLVDLLAVAVDRGCGRSVLEAAAANVLIVEGATVVTPPLDERLLPGTMRARVLAAAQSAGFGASQEPVTLERMAAADEVLPSSAISGVRPAAFARRRPPRFETGARLHDVLREPAVVATR